MKCKNSSPPQMLTIREIAETGLLSESTLRHMLKEGQLPVMYVGKKALVNFDKLCEQFSSLEAPRSKL